jgi:ABC-type hemin transport system substrate-binding protein
MTKKVIIDQMQRSVELTFPLKRIVSLVPSQTELLHYFGLEQEVVGITKFSIHPKNWYAEKTRIGGTKKLNIDQIIALKPMHSFRNEYGVFIREIFEFSSEILRELTQAMQRD